MSASDLVGYIAGIRTPTQQDKVYKDECILSFDTPDSPDGIYVCLHTFLGFSRRFVQMYHAATGNGIFLNIRRIAHPVVKKSAASAPALGPAGGSGAGDSASSSDDEIKPKITRLAFNIPGGFQTNEPQFEYEDINTIVLLPEFKEIPLNDPNLPECLILSVSGILSADSASRQAELEAMKNTWDGEVRKASKHADNLIQLPNPPQIPPSNWKCDICEIRSSLWLNLTDGTVRCGRRNFDGSGGNNHAKEHYEITKYPLVVKLGTITGDGADVFSYEEDAMVDDPKLAAHLAHFGIVISQMQKTEKSMIEMEIDLNQRYDEWSIIQEDGQKLRSLYGPTFTGLVNLGNSCYLNSIMQVLFSIPDFVDEFYRADPGVQFAQSNHSDPSGDLRTQLMKLAAGLQSGDYSKPDPRLPNNEQSGIKPRMFKTLIGRNHAEFSSKRQQDAQEFLLHVIDRIERLPRTGQEQQQLKRGPPTDCFKFEVEERMQCGQSKKVKYTTRSDFLLSLPIANVPVQNQEQYDAFLSAKKVVEDAGGKVDNDQIVRPVVKMVDCLRAFAADVVVEDFHSTATQSKTFALMRTRLRTFPDYLVIHMKKFTLGDDWTPKKLDVSLDVPDELDIEDLRGLGQQPGEELLPVVITPPTTPTPAAPTFEPNADFLSQLTDMGFDVQGCRRALFHTQNAGVEPAMNWIFEHMGDADFAAPFVPPSAGGSRAGGPSAAAAAPAPFEINTEALANIMAMGFEDRQARLALKLNQNRPDAAIEWIFNNIANFDEIARQEEEQERVAAVAAAATQVQTYRNGSPKYQLMALVSHMGQSTMCGHYVAHIRKQIREDTVVADLPLQPSPGSDEPTSAVAPSIEVPGTTTATSTATGEPASPTTGDVAPLVSPTPPTVSPPKTPKPGSYQWTIFNDNKVAVSEKPPVQFAYLYIYKRIE